MKDVSEDDILDFLGPGHALIPEKEDKGVSSVPNKVCPKCNQVILVTMHICPYCHTFIAQIKDY